MDEEQEEKFFNYQKIAATLITLIFLKNALTDDVISLIQQMYNRISAKVFRCIIVRGIKLLLAWCVIVNNKPCPFSPILTGSQIDPVQPFEVFAA